MLRGCPTANSHAEPSIFIQSLKPSNMGLVSSWMGNPYPSAARCCSRASMWLNGPLNGVRGLYPDQMSELGVQRKDTDSANYKLQCDK